MRNEKVEKPPFDEVVQGLKTKSDKIRALAKAGYLRTEISELLDIRYQHVRKVLVDSGITDGLKSGVTADRSPLPITPDYPKPKNNISWEVLLKAGFQYVGDWVVTEDQLSIDGTVPRKPGVYALIVDDNIAYIGLTLNGLHTRMDQYRRGHKGQRTSARIKQHILDALTNGSRIKVLAASPEPGDWNGLPINTAAGLEAGLIQLIRPTWNIQGVK